MKTLKLRNEAEVSILHDAMRKYLKENKEILSTTGIMFIENCMSLLWDYKNNPVNKYIRVSDKLLIEEIIKEKL